MDSCVEKLISCKPVTGYNMKDIKYFKEWNLTCPGWSLKRKCNLLIDFQSKLFIDEECFDELRKIFTHHLIVTENEEENKLITHILEENNYYHDLEELIQFVDILEKYTKSNTSLTRLSLINKLNYLFAVDGFEFDNSVNYKPYVKNLCIPLNNGKDEKKRSLFSFFDDKKNYRGYFSLHFINEENIKLDPLTLHVLAVRNLYEKFQSLVNPEKIQKAITKLFYKNEIKYDDDDEIADSYKSFIGEENLNKVMVVLENKIKKT